ncbi:MAG: protease inhibitor I9 family protein, partial [Nocardioidaceae bacterium]
MRRSALFAAAACTLLTLGSTALSAQASPAPADSLESGSYIVVLDEGTAAARVADLHAQQFGVDVGHVYRSALSGYSATMTASAADLVAAAPAVAWVQKDTAVHTAAQTLPTGINRADADLSPTANINGSDQRVNVDVAVIDTGVDLTHPDINVY